MTTIKDIAEQFNISAHAIRFYEKEGLLTIPRDKNGNRVFDEKAISRMRAIIYYRNLGLHVKEIRDLLADFHNHDKSLKILRHNLEELNSKIRELQATKLYIEEKIELHELLNRLDKEGKTLDEQNAAYQAFKAEKAKVAEDCK